MYHARPLCYQPSNPASLVRKGFLKSVNDVYFYQENAIQSHPGLVVFEVSGEVAFPHFVDIEVGDMAQWVNETLGDEAVTALCIQGQLHIFHKNSDVILVDIYNCLLPSDASHETFSDTVSFDFVAWDENEAGAVA